MRIDITVVEDSATPALQALLDAGADMRPAYEQMGEYLIMSIRQRFQAGIAPDGTPWAPNSPVTYMRFLSAFKGSFKKSGKISARGAERAIGKRPLIGESRALSTQIAKRVDADGVEVGSTMEYAAVQHFGALRGEFGRTRRGGPIPWGDIPARPFLGISSEDRLELLAILREHLNRSSG